MDRFLSPPEYNFPTITNFNLSYSVSPHHHPPSSPLPPPSQTHHFLHDPLSLEMEQSVEAVEKILKYSFMNKTLLKEALTHSSLSYERLEFVGDMALGLAVTNHLYLVYTKLEPHKLSLLRAANVSTEKLARVSIYNGLYRFLQHNSPALDDKVKEFRDAVAKENDSAAYGGLVKAPKVLADLFESIVGAVYIDLNFDLQRLWVIFRGLLEPIFTLDDLEKQPQPVTRLFQVCSKHDKRVELRYTKDGKNSIVAGVYLDGEFFTSGRAENKDTAKLIAAKDALWKLPASLPADMSIDEGIEEELKLEESKMKLNVICSKKKWPKPVYSIEEESGNGNPFVCSVMIKTEEGTLYMKGDEKPRKREAENSSAYHMIRALRNSSYL